jgi:hypothetical protein
VSSATAHDTAGAPLIKRCTKPINDLLQIDQNLCFHTSLPHNPAIVSAILAAVRTQTQPTAVVDIAPVSAVGQPKPGEAIIDRGTAQCEGGSDSVPQAYRCFSRSGIADPCWASNHSSGRLSRSTPVSRGVSSYPTGTVHSRAGHARQLQRQGRGLRVRASPRRAGRPG